MTNRALTTPNGRKLSRTYWGTCAFIDMLGSKLNWAAYWSISQIRNIWQKHNSLEIWYQIGIT